MAKKLRYFDGNVVAKIEKESFLEFYSVLAGGDYLILAVKALILAGISPVAKVGRRFQKYSASYLAFLKGEVRFYTSRGRVRAYSITSKNKSGKSKKGKFPKPFPNKKLTPVNLYATGEMMDSLQMRAVRNTAYIGFTDEKAKYHDKLGAGKSRVIRRLLPTRQGEKFVSNIDRDVKALAKASITKVLQNNRLGLKINFVLSTKR